MLNKNGLAVPASCEGKLTSDCSSPGFLEINVNQSHGASGGPVVDKRGSVIGMVSFSDQGKNLVYAIHGQIIKKMME